MNELTCVARATAYELLIEKRGRQAFLLSKYSHKSKCEFPRKAYLQKSIRIGSLRSADFLRTELGGRGKNPSSPPPLLPPPPRAPFQKPSVFPPPFPFGGCAISKPPTDRPTDRRSRNRRHWIFFYSRACVYQYPLVFNPRFWSKLYFLPLFQKLMYGLNAHV